MTCQRGTTLAKLREHRACCVPAAGIHRQLFRRRVTGCLEYSAAVAQTREAGADERHFRTWLKQSFLAASNNIVKHFEAIRTFDHDLTMPPPPGEEDAPS